MKKHWLLSLILCLSLGQISAQQTQKISDEERKLSPTYADGLREFYAADYETAEKTFRSILTKNPKHDASYFMLGKIKSATQAHVEAAEYFKQASSLNKNNEWYKVELAQAYDLTGNYAASAKLWEELAKLKPNIDYYLELQANALLHLQKYAEAVKVYDQLESVIGFNEELTEQKKNVWLVMGNVEKAAKEYEKLIEIFPYETKYYIAAGDVWLTNKQYAKAYPFYQQAEKINPNDPQLLFALAEYYELVGNDKGSWDCLLKILSNPDVSTEELMPTIQNIFTSYVLQGSRSGISREMIYNILYQFTTHHPEVAEGWSELATLNIMDQDYTTAKKNLETSIALDDTRYMVWEDYFFVLGHLNDDQTILSNAEKVTELFPGNSMILYTIGVAYLNVNQLDKSLSTLKQAANFSYEPLLSASIYEMIGNVYFEQKNQKEAVHYWQMAKQKGLKSAKLDEKLKQYE